MQPTAAMLQGSVPTIMVPPAPGAYRANPGGQPDETEYTRVAEVTGPPSVWMYQGVGAPSAQPWDDIQYGTPSLTYSEGGHDRYSYRVGAPPIPRAIAGDKYYTAQIFVNGDAVGEVVAMAPPIPTSGANLSAYRGGY